MDDDDNEREYREAEEREYRRLVDGVFCETSPEKILSVLDKYSDSEVRLIARIASGYGHDRVASLACTSCARRIAHYDGFMGLADSSARCGTLLRGLGLAGAQCFARKILESNTVPLAKSLSLARGRAHHMLRLSVAANDRLDAVLLHSPLDGNVLCIQCDYNLPERVNEPIMRSTIHSRVKLKYENFDVQKHIADAVRDGFLYHHIASYQLSCDGCVLLAFGDGALGIDKIFVFTRNAAGTFMLSRHFKLENPLVYQRHVLCRGLPKTSFANLEPTISMSSDGSSVVGTCATGEICTISLLDGATRILAVGEKVTAAAYSCTGAYIALGTYDGNVMVYEATLTRCVDTIKIGRPISVIRWNCDEETLAVVAGSTVAVVWGRGGSVVQTIVADDERPYADVAWNSDGKRLLLALPTGGLEVADLRSGKILHAFRIPGCAIIAANFSPDDSHVIATCIYNGQLVVLVWDIVNDMYRVYDKADLRELSELYTLIAHGLPTRKQCGTTAAQAMLFWAAAYARENRRTIDIPSESPLVREFYFLPASLQQTLMRHLRFFERAAPSSPVAERLCPTPGDSQKK